MLQKKSACGQMAASLAPGAEAAGGSAWAGCSRLTAALAEPGWAVGMPRLRPQSRGPLRVVWQCLGVGEEKAVSLCGRGAGNGNARVSGHCFRLM